VTAFFDQAAQRLGVRRQISDAIVTTIHNRGMAWSGDVDKIRNSLLFDLGSRNTATDKQFIRWVLYNYPLPAAR
jgi:hypothetical protein